MKLIRGSDNFPADMLRPVVALGNFDGVHRGHARIIEGARGEASKIGGTSAVYTFNPHPVRILAPAECPPLIQTLDQRIRSIEALGVEALVIEPFTAEFAALDAAAFFKTIIVGRLRAAGLVAGYDFTFGQHRQGNADLLSQLCVERGMAISVLPAQFSGETLISSTNVRRLIERGQVGETTALLGRPYEIEGKVVRGRGRGGGLGAHTANIETANEIIPPSGVYLTRTRPAPCGRPRASITSIGPNPTFPGSPFTVETHLIDVQVDLSGQTICVEFLDRMRDQITFKTPELLKEQIKRDIDAARDMHSRRNHR